MAAQKKQSQNQTYQASIEELQEIIKAIEDEKITVDELEIKVKRGAELIKFCKEKLTNTEKAVDNILEDLDQHSYSDNQDKPEKET